MIQWTDSDDEYMRQTNMSIIETIPPFFIRQLFHFLDSVPTLFEPVQNLRVFFKIEWKTNDSSEVIDPTNIRAIFEIGGTIIDEFHMEHRRYGTIGHVIYRLSKHADWVYKRLSNKRFNNGTCYLMMKKC